MRWIILLLLAQLPSVPPVDGDDCELAKVRRIYVDVLTGGESALKIRELLITSLQSSKVFLITEDSNKADAILKGAAKDEVFTDSFSSSESLNAHSQLGGSGSGSTSTKGKGYLGLTIGENDSRRTEERRHEAVAAVHLVTKDGDVIWSATAESLGAKFQSASCEVADRITKKLNADFKAAKTRTRPEPAPPANP